MRESAGGCLTALQDAHAARGETQGPTAGGSCAAGVRFSRALGAYRTQLGIERALTRGASSGLTAAECELILSGVRGVLSTLEGMAEIQESMAQSQEMKA